MSRNVKATQAAIFRRLAAVVEAAALVPPMPLAAGRFILGGDQDTEALKSAKLLRNERVSAIGSASLLEWDTRHYFALPRIASIQVGADQEVIAEVQNGGLASLIFVDGETDLAGLSALEVVEHIFGAEGGYPLETVAPFFVPHRLYQAHPSLDGMREAELWSRCQALCALGLVEGMASTAAPLNACRTNFGNACRSGAAKVAGSGLLAAAVAGTWGHAFLEVYRAIEILFPVMCVEDFLATLPPAAAAAPRQALLEALENTLQWRLRQETALKRLVGKLPKPVTDSLAQRIGVGADAEKVATAIYKARNGIAHGALVSAPVANKDAFLAVCIDLLCAAYDAVIIPEEWLQ